MLDDTVSFRVVGPVWSRLNLAAVAVSPPVARVARALQLRARDLAAHDAGLFEPVKPAISKAHGIAHHDEDTGLFEHGQRASAKIARPPALLIPRRLIRVQVRVKLGEGQLATGGLQGIHHGAPDLAQALNAFDCRLDVIPHPAGLFVQPAPGLTTRRRPPQAGGAQPFTTPT